MLGIPVEGVIPTTNHLESFNGVLKGTHLRRWRKGGRRIRVDVLIHALTIYILPSIFKERRMISEQATRIAALVRLLPGGAALLDHTQDPKPVPTVPKVAYLVLDEKRDERARELLYHRQISTPTVLPGNVGLTLTSYSSRALSIDVQPTTYTIRLGFNGVVCCDCPDFEEQGGACKHIRGALMIVNDMRRNGTPIPDIPIPRSLADAQSLQSTMLTIKIRRPTVKAAEEIQAILQKDEACDVDGGEGGDEDDSSDEDDSASVSTDASSDSENDESKGVNPSRATQNVAALGEQAFSRAMFELDDIAPRLADLGAYLDHRMVGLSPEETAKAGIRFGEIAAFMTRFQRVLDLPSSATASVPDPVTASIAPTSDSAQNSKKRKQLLPPSPEKMQKRHQSFGIH
ncbi:hypothetical protein MSAN_01140100 [Mycena sanguinolenta]|uniref:SWIM-type domain-containing protein n=1 Tax=Mycena sanguinolenta TaxID=230812 RepID=A0A8H7D3R2_9AGAR|nr:hypothetical protein MSAN_01140100 [Mycena sanguinolenta]